MKKIFIILLLSVLVINVSLADVTDASQTNLYGRITDINGDPVIGVSIYIPELKTGGITDTDGKYKIENLPMRKIQIQISAIGYKMKMDNANLLVSNKRDYVGKIVYMGIDVHNPNYGLNFS